MKRKRAASSFTSTIQRVVGSKSGYFVIPMLKASPRGFTTIVVRLLSGPIIGPGLIVHPWADGEMIGTVSSHDSFHSVGLFVLAQPLTRTSKESRVVIFIFCSPKRCMHTHAQNSGTASETNPGQPQFKYHTVPAGICFGGGWTRTKRTAGGVDGWSCSGVRRICPPSIWSVSVHSPRNTVSPASRRRRLTSCQRAGSRARSRTRRPVLSPQTAAASETRSPQPVSTSSRVAAHSG